MRDREIHFNSCIDWLDLAWRLPGESPCRLFDIRQLEERAQLAERGLMDALFMADFYIYRAGFSMEPLTVLSALATMTRHIGLIASVSTTYNEPYDLARLFASLDHISNGRAGWNMVTTAVDKVSQNYSKKEHLEHDTRYARAHEVVQIVTRLWAGSHTNRIDTLDHQGDWFTVKGDINMPPSPQGQPVRMQAGSSQAGRDFGAHWAEIIFTAQPILAVAQDFYSDIHQRMATLGRAPHEANILPGLMPIVCHTRSEAEDLLAARAGPDQGNASRMREMVGFDLTTLPQDEPVPLELLPPKGSTNGMRGRSDLYLDLIRKHRLTPRQVLGQGAHLAYAGTPMDMADLISEWFTGKGCDGFTLMWPSLEANILFVDEVIPILQKRGLYRTAYTGTTLREHFNLKAFT